jgi:hypothetical protein
LWCSAVRRDPRHGSEVAHPAEEAPGDAGRAAGAAGDLQRAVVGQIEVELAGAAADDRVQLVHVVELQPQRDAEAVAQRLGQQAGARGGADQGEGRQVDPHRARRRTLADDEVEAEVLHRRVERFLDGGLKAVDLVDEQHVARLQIGQDRGEVAGAHQQRAGGGAEANPQFARHDLRERGLAEARRAVE